MTAIEFDQEIRQRRAETQKTGAPPTDSDSRLRERLTKESHTADETMLELVYAWRHYESAGGRGFSQTLEMIEFLLLHGKQRPMLTASLFSIKAELMQQLHKDLVAAEMFAKAIDELHALHLDVDMKRMYAMMKLGHLLLSQDNKENAEKLFLDILSYPWYLVMEANSQSLLRTYYVSAGLGLIDCRRGDLSALQETFFVPATLSELQPVLDLAIGQARGTIDGNGE